MSPQWQALWQTTGLNGVVGKASAEITTQDLWLIKSISQQMFLLQKFFSSDDFYILFLLFKILIYLFNKYLLNTSYEIGQFHLPQDLEHARGDLCNLISTEISN